MPACEENRRERSPVWRYLTLPGTGPYKVAVPSHDPQMLKGVLSLLLLRLVAEREDYGYSIVVRLHEMGFDDLAEGSVYPALSRLAGNGLLASRLVRSASGPARNYYSITDAGKAEIARSLAAWRGLVTAVDDILHATSSPGA